MTARAIGALTRAGWLQARSYRLAFLLQIFSLLMIVVPIYFIAGALQPTMATTIAVESHQYFSFVLVGSVALMFINPEHMHVLFTERAGKMMIAATVVLQTTGYLWIRKIVTIEV